MSSVWVNDLDDEEKKKQMQGAMPKGFEGPAGAGAMAPQGPSTLDNAGNAAGSAVGTKLGTMAGAYFGPWGAAIGGALGGSLGGSLFGGGGGGAPAAAAPKFDGGDLINQEDTSVKIAGTVPQQAAPLNPQMKDQMAFDEEEYMRKFGGGNYA